MCIAVQRTNERLTNLKVNPKSNVAEHIKDLQAFVFGCDGKLADIADQVSVCDRASRNISLDRRDAERMLIELEAGLNVAPTLEEYRKKIKAEEIEQKRDYASSAQGAIYSATARAEGIHRLRPKSLEGVELQSNWIACIQTKMDGPKVRPNGLVHSADALATTHLTRWRRLRGRSRRRWRRRRRLQFHQLCAARGNEWRCDVKAPTTTITAKDRRARNLALALRLAALGIYVFPSRDKTPLFAGWQTADHEYNDAQRNAVITKALEKNGFAPVHVGSTKNPSVIKRVWGEHPDCVPSISCDPSEIYVIDADSSLSSKMASGRRTVPLSSPST